MPAGRRAVQVLSTIAALSEIAAEYLEQRGEAAEAADLREIVARTRARLEAVIAREQARGARTE